MAGIVHYLMVVQRDSTPFIGCTKGLYTISCLYKGTVNHLMVVQRDCKPFNGCTKGL